MWNLRHCHYLPGAGWSVRGWSTKLGIATIAMVTAVFLGGCGASLNNGPQASLSPGQNEPMGLSTNQPQETSAVSASKSVPASVASDAAQVVAVSTPGNVMYKVGPLDVLEVSVFNVAELSKTVQVAGTGTINLPLVGEIPAAGHTAQEIERDLAKRLGEKYLQNPQVTVFVKEYNSQRVTIEGAVKKPGVYPLQGKTSLLQFVATAEGLTDVADTDVAVFRSLGGKRSAARFNVDDIRAGKADDPSVEPGDVIVVGTSALKTAYQNVLRVLPVTGTFVGLF